MGTIVDGKIKKIIIVLISIFLIVGCGGITPEPTTIDTTSTETRSPTESVNTTTPSPVKPTDTPVPLAALVNGEPITMAEFEAELAQYQAVQDDSGMNLATDAESFVLDDMINQVLLAQSAQEAGYYLDESGVQTRMDELAGRIGGQEALIDWYTEHGYTEPVFHMALVRGAASAWMRDRIISEAPLAAEQVHAQQILLYNEEQADQVYDLLQSGQEFTTLATSYDPVTGGELGWFPRGYLTQPEIDEVAFDLAPGEYSQVIKTDLGYHIIQVLEKDSQRSLDPDAYAILQIQTLQDWLDTRRGESDIQILLP